MLSTYRLLSFFLLFPLALAGCKSMPVQNLAKTDVDLVSEAFIDQMYTHVDTLMVKLYKRNPRELHKQPGMTVAERRAMVFNHDPAAAYAELRGLRGAEAMELAFDDSFAGDRVFAVSFGLASMLQQSYDNHREMYLFDQLDEQKIYRAARNIEVLVWKLNHKRNPSGEHYLITSRSGNAIDNQSFDRLYGKMVALQDMLAHIVADKNNRAIKTVVQNTLTTVFLPL